MAKILEGTFSSFDNGFEIYYLMQWPLNMRYSWDNQKKGQNNKKLGSASLRNRKNVLHRRETSITPCRTGLTGWVTTWENPVLYSLGSQAGEVVINDPSHLKNHCMWAEFQSI